MNFKKGFFKRVKTRMNGAMGRTATLRALRFVRLFLKNALRVAVLPIAVNVYSVARSS
jgi:hypothetical protein